MDLSAEQQKLYEDFYESTCNDTVLDTKTELLVGLASAIAVNCQPCTAYYLKRCKAAAIPKAEVQAVLAKVMAVAAGQKRLQTESVLKNWNIEY